MVGIGIAGLASYYSVYYANRADQRPDTSVTAAARLDASDGELEALGRLPAGEFANTFDCRIHDSFDELLSDDDVDAIVACSLLGRRAGDAVSALEAGKPVLTGKPAADSARAAERIEDAANDAGIVAATTAPHRHDGRIQQAHSRVVDGGVGDVLRVRASVYHPMASEPGIEARDGLAPGEPGPAYTMGYYTADILQWFVGDSRPVRLTGELENTNSPFMDHPDVGSATVKYEDGTLGTMTFAMCTDGGPLYGWEIEVTGTDGTIRTDHTGAEGMHWHDGESGAVEVFGRSVDPVLDRQFDAFEDAVRRGAGPDGVAPEPATAASGIGLCDAWVGAAEADGRVDIERRR